MKDAISKDVEWVRAYLDTQPEHSWPQMRVVLAQYDYLAGRRLAVEAATAKCSELAKELQEANATIKRLRAIIADKDQHAPHEGFPVAGFFAGNPSPLSQVLQSKPVEGHDHTGRPVEKTSPDNITPIQLGPVQRLDLEKGETPGDLYNQGLAVMHPGFGNTPLCQQNERDRTHRIRRFQCMQFIKSGWSFAEVRSYNGTKVPRV